MEHQISAISTHLPTSPESLEQYRQGQKEDPLLQQVSLYCREGWPNRDSLHGDIKHYWQVRHDITTCDNILMYHNCIIVPEKLRTLTMQNIHQGHQGIERRRLRLTTAVWWPGSSKEMKEFVEQCPTCL